MDVIIRENYQTPAGWELYDMVKDPHETKNIYDDPKACQTR